jgi:bifunctional non-homologous end joining protein LigD
MRSQLQYEAILEGEIVCLDSEGRSQFHELLRGRGRESPAVFHAFDLLCLDGEDLPTLPLIERKRLLRAAIPEQPSTLLYASHIEGQGLRATAACDGRAHGLG